MVGSKAKMLTDWSPGLTNQRFKLLNELWKRGRPCTHWMPRRKPRKSN